MFREFVVFPSKQWHTTFCRESLPLLGICLALHFATLLDLRSEIEGANWRPD